jgi:hypothetical protein
MSGDAQRTAVVASIVTGSLLVLVSCLAFFPPAAWSGKAKATSSKPSKPKPRRTGKAETPVVDDGDDLAPSEGRGYKTRADGKRTTYFDREVSAEAKALLGDSTPKRIDPSAAAPAAAASPKRIDAAAPSTWNGNGTTYEERDLTKTASSGLKRRLKRLEIDGGSVAVSVASVSALEGSASRTFSRGKVRHVYDYEAAVELTATGPSGKVFRGALKTEDLNPNAVSEGEVELRMEWAAGNSPSGEDYGLLKQALTADGGPTHAALVAALREFEKSLEAM